MVIYQITSKQISFEYGGFKINGCSKPFSWLCFFLKKHSQENMLLNKVWKTPLILNPPFKGKFVNMGNRPKIIKQPLTDYAPRQWGDN